jgi:hypothetical protein
MSTPSRLKQGLLAVLLLLQAQATVLAQQPRVSTVTIRTSGALPTEMQALLAEVGQDEVLDVSRATDPYDVVRANCGGTVTKDYLSAVAKLNPDFVFRTESDARKLRVPPCVRVAKNVLVPARKGDDANSFAKRVMGVSGDDKVLVCDPNAPPSGFPECRMPAAKALAWLNGRKRQLGPQDFEPGKVLLTPTKTWPTTITLKQGIEAQDVLAAINKAMPAGKNGVPTAVAEAGWELIPLLNASSDKIQGSCTGMEAPENWPFNVQAVMAKLKAGKEIALQRNYFHGPTVIRVGDTGFHGIGSYFPLPFVATNPFDKADQPEDKDKNGYRADQYGISADNQGDLEPFSDDPQGPHGTQVADMALGSSELRAAYPELSSILQVSFIKLFGKKTGAIRAEDGLLYSAMAPIKNQDEPRVINFSVGSKDPTSTQMFAATLRSARSSNVLVVVASGNDGDDIGISPTFPASYGGTESDFLNTLLTVGAVAPDGSIASFSNRSESRVDILAAGCRVPSRSASGTVDLLNGTSISAPQASFCAGSLNALGIRDMWQVKQRMLVSADHVPQLHEYTRLGGIVLNVERALSVFDDVMRIEGANSSDQVGTWKRPTTPLQVCASGKSLPSSAVLSVSAYQVSAETWVRVLSSGFDGRMEAPINCPASDASVTFSTASGQEQVVPLKQLAAFVPRFQFEK